MAALKSTPTEVSTSASIVGRPQGHLVGSGETQETPSEYVACTYQVSEWGQAPRMCLRVARKIVVWSERYGTQHYCATHWRGVKALVGPEDEVCDAPELEMC